MVLDVVADDRVEHRRLAEDLRLVRSRTVEHQAVVVAEEVRRIPALDEEATRPEHRGERRLEERLPGLAVHARVRVAHLHRLRLEGGDVGQARGEVTVRDLELVRGVEVPHGRRDRLVARVEPRLEGAKVAVDRLDLEESLRRREIDHHDAVEVVGLLEGLEVRLEDGDLLAMVLGGDHVAAAQLLDVRGGEDRGPGANLLEVRANALEDVRREHLVVQRALVDVGEVEVPPREDEAFERRELEQLGDRLGDSRLGLLGHHSDARGEPPLHELDARDERRRDGSVDPYDGDSDAVHGGLLDSMLRRG